jgi:bifunctional non-homologous end joining protein LigD
VICSGAQRAVMPAWIEPELATLVSEPPEGAAWVHELKLDGYRLLCRIEDRKARLYTRRGNDWTDSFPTVARACEALPCERAMIDGEAVILDARGMSDFQALQSSLGSARPDLFFVAFDLLHRDGWDLRKCPLSERKEALSDLLERGPDALRFSGHVLGKGAAFFAEACRIRAEGIVSKRADAPYRSGRTRDWLKAKCLLRQEFVIVGFTEPSGSRAGIGALLVGAHDAGGALFFCGKVGTGYTAQTLNELRRLLEPIERSTPPVINPLRGANARGVHWVEPRMVVEVKFTGWTNDRVIRHPSFQGLRRDKSAREVVIEKPIPEAG